MVKTMAVLAVLLLPPAAAAGQTPDPRPVVPASTAPPTLELSLEEAVRRAVDHNPTLTVVRLGVDRQSSRVAAAKGSFVPVFGSAAGRSSLAVPPSSSFFGTEPITTGEWFASAGVSQRLEKGGGSWSVVFDGVRSATDSPFSSFDPSLQAGLLLAFSQPLLRDRETDPARHQYAIARRDAATSELEYREAVVQTVAAVKQAYWTLKATRANITLQQRSLELAEALVRENRTRVEVGQTPPIDLVQAEAEVAQRREGLIQAQSIAGDAEDRLRRLIMDPADRTFWMTKIEPVSDPDGPARSVDADRAIASAINERLDLARARQDLATAGDNVTFLQNQKRPDVRVEASYRGGGAGGTQLIRNGFPGDITGTINRHYGSVLGQLFTHDYASWSVGFTASYPLGRSREEANLARAEVERLQVTHRIAGLELEIAEAVRRTARQVQSTAERIEAARAGESLAVQRLDVERKRFDAGLSTTFLVTQAQRDLLQAQVSLLQAMLDHQAAVVDFEAVQLASPATLMNAGGSLGLNGAELIALPTPAPRGIFRQGGGH
jgi:outer membrane protein TolC